EVSPLTRKRCIAAGRLESQKNFRDLITAWKTVDGRHPDWTLSIYGNGRQKDALQSQIDSEGLKGKVILEGNTSDMRKEMLDSSCLVMSSRFEGFPMILLEALTTGLPIVSYDCPKGPSEIVTIGANGYLAKVGDTMTLAQGICSVISNEELRSRFGAESKRRSENFTLERIMVKWDSLFREITGQ
ncbi:MAG TPA: glycosyltransferase family 4 protein, partial [Rikenellaceae bacterium]|nr:glycosyltransferase family 4 protein [Rikenellaceae bacterium]